MGNRNSTLMGYSFGLREEEPSDDERAFFGIQDSPVLRQPTSPDINFEVQHGLTI